MSAHHICKARCEKYNGTVTYQVLLRLFLQGFKGHYVQYLLACGGESGDKAILLMYVTYRHNSCNVHAALQLLHVYNQFIQEYYYFSGC